MLVFAGVITMMAAGHVVTIPTFSNVMFCHGLCNGSATASVSGGVGPFAYSWSPTGGTATTASALCAGSYTVTVTDSSDMSTAAASIIITEPAVFSITSITSSAGTTICSGVCTT